MQDSTGGLKLEKQMQEKDPERFYCPYPGCNRSFAELWRLKVHYRAPPDIRGSGKERGHGTELMQCPKCGKSLKPGKHHVGCSAGRSAPRQATKRTRLALPDPSILDLALLKDDQVLLTDGTATESLMQQLVGSFPQQMLTDTGNSGFPDLLQQQQQQQALQIVTQQPDFSGFSGFFGVSQQTLPLYQQLQQQDQQVVPLQQLAAQQQPQQQQAQQQPDLQTDLSAVFASFPNASIAPVQQSAPSTGPTLNFQPDDALSFLGVFDYDDNHSSLFTVEPPTPPSPPPLPADFDHNKAGGMLFQFSQFSQKLPSNIPTASTPNEPSTSQIASTPAESGDSWTGALGYEKTNDGDLMHILFGLPDEYPTMATVHLHQWEQPSSSTFNAHTQEQQGQRQDHGSLDFESPAFANLNTDLESSLDLHFDTMDAEDDCTAPTSHTSSLTAVEPGSSMHVKAETSSDKNSETHADSHTSHTGLMRKEGFGGDDEMLEPHLSPAALVKGDKPVIPRTSTFERELYHLLRPCE